MDNKYTPIIKFKQTRYGSNHWICFSPKLNFDFEYRWEVYVPASIRKYGCYVLPVLYGDIIIARFEPEVHRGDAPLVIKNWWWEDRELITDDNVIREVNDCLTRFCRFLKASRLSNSSYNAIFRK